jgi:hypothetical protein
LNRLRHPFNQSQQVKSENSTTPSLVATPRQGASIPMICPSITQKSSSPKLDATADGVATLDTTIELLKRSFVNMS